MQRALHPAYEGLFAVSLVGSLAEVLGTFFRRRYGRPEFVPLLNAEASLGSLLNEILTAFFT